MHELQRELSTATVPYHAWARYTCIGLRSDFTEGMNPSFSLSTMSCTFFVARINVSAIYRCGSSITNVFVGLLKDMGTSKMWDELGHIQRHGYDILGNGQCARGIGKQFARLLGLKGDY